MHVQVEGEKRGLEGSLRCALTPTPRPLTPGGGEHLTTQYITSQHDTSLHWSRVEVPAEV